MRKIKSPEYEYMEQQLKLPIRKVVTAFDNFMKFEASGGVLLLLSTIVALVWANSPFADSYFELWHMKATIGIGGFVLNKSLEHWINDGLMAMFFFVIGLEIKRELLIGELSSPKKAALPIVAAIGGIVLPALIFLFLNPSAPESSGWGIPVATDIAFAIGVLALLGDRVPLSLKIFLTSLAIVDDIGAVLIIALFYTSDISLINLLIGACFMVALIAANWMGIRSTLLYAVLGIGGLWLAFLLSGIHSTIAGVLAAMAIPAQTRINADEFVEKGRYYLDKFSEASEKNLSILGNSKQLYAAESVESASKLVQTPLQRLEHALHPWVIYVVMPLFALANAGVTIDANLFSVLKHPVTYGIVAGLFIGKQAGITLFSWIAVKIGIADLPRGVSWKQVYGLGCIAGIGFTMSIFIAGLAFSDPEILKLAKLGILIASFISGVAGFLILGRKSIQPSSA